ncbi:MAG: hypothetical protein FWC34_11085 [Bacteroidetes bacterium]|nr:hypothetical protein [Bacteroidota bacterium]MCL2302914.1 hypothetical protein [Lentimicrobiaceae bacterium]
MKKLMFISAILLNCFMGGLLASTIEVAPLYGAIGLNVIAMTAGNCIPAGALGAGIYKEVWTGEMIKAFRNAAESLGWYGKIRSYDDKVDNEVIHFVQIGGDPQVLVNNTSYPIPIVALPDADKPISLDKYQTEVTPVTDDELYAISYDKMSSVIERHHEQMAETKYSRALHALAPAYHSTATPVILTSGANDGSGRATMTRKDIIAMKKAFDKMKVPTVGRVLVLCPDHVNDLLENDQKFATQYYNYVTGKISNLYSFEVYEYVDCPHFTASTQTKKAWGSVPGAGDYQASVAFHVKRAMRADGTTKPYFSEAASDPQNQQNLLNFRHYSICLPLKMEALGAIVSKAA